MNLLFSYRDIQVQYTQVREKTHTWIILKLRASDNFTLSDFKDYDAMVKLVETLEMLPTCDLATQPMIQFHYAFALNRYTGAAFISLKHSFQNIYHHFLFWSCDFFYNVYFFFFVCNVNFTTTNMLFPPIKYYTDIKVFYSLVNNFFKTWDTIIERF